MKMRPMGQTDQRIIKCHFFTQDMYGSLWIETLAFTNIDLRIPFLGINWTCSDLVCISFQGSVICCALFLTYIINELPECTRQRPIYISRRYHVAIYSFFILKHTVTSQIDPWHRPCEVRGFRSKIGIFSSDINKKSIKE